MQYVMHDWSDDVCVKILTQCKKAVCSQEPNGGGKVIIIDAIVGSPCKAMFGAQVLLDLLMMVVTSGKERDEEVRRKIFTEAGFRHYEAKPLLGFMSIIELYP
jgi:trans-resveratrol di-O-methyltransferase